MNVVPFPIRSRPDAKTPVIATRRRRLFNNQGEALAFANACGVLIGSNDYSPLAQAWDAVEQILAQSWEHHFSASTTDKMVHALVIAIAQRSEDMVHQVQLMDDNKNMLFFISDVNGVNMTFATGYAGTDLKGVKSFKNIVINEWQWKDGELEFTADSYSSSEDSGDGDQPPEDEPGNHPA